MFKVPRNKLSMHDRFVQELVEQIKDKYDFLIYNVPIGNTRRTLGEIDIIGRCGDKYDLYEVKCSFRIFKAKKQLARAMKFLDFENMRSFFYCGSSRKIVSM